MTGSLPTFARAPQETPALYEEKDGKPALVAYDLEEDGLFIARHVLGNGWLQIGKEKAKWALHPAEGGAVIEWKRLYPKPAGACREALSLNGAWRLLRF